MRFIDRCKIHVIAGTGGNGCVAFLREKHMPYGGPSGGDGGKGGDIVFVADPGKTTLIDLAYQRTVRAKPGEHGRGKDQYGHGGADTEIRVPLGTQVLDDETSEIIVDVREPGDRFVIAKGGRGGRGNIHFSTPYDRAPRRAEPGEEGQELELRLELKVMADVGLLGFPNVGKSTFIRACSRAQPKVADYPFTTLTPHLGVVRIGEESTFVLADIPGLIPGASEGAGLGVQFLQHVERTRALLHLVTLDPGEDREPLADFDAIMNELRSFDEELAERPMLVALSKADITEVRDLYPALAAAFAERGIHLYLVSAATHDGVDALLRDLYHVVHGGEAKVARPVAGRSGAVGRSNSARVAAEGAGDAVATSKARSDSGSRTTEKSGAAQATKGPAKKTAAKKNAPKKNGSKKAAPNGNVAKKAPAATKKKLAARKTQKKKTATAKKKPARAVLTVTNKKPTRKVARKVAKKKPVTKPLAGKRATARSPAKKKSTGPKKPLPKKRERTKAFAKKAGKQSSKGAARAASGKKRSRS